MLLEATASTRPYLATSFDDDSGGTSFLVFLLSLRAAAHDAVTRRHALLFYQPQP